MSDDPHLATHHWTGQCVTNARLSLTKLWKWTVEGQTLHKVKLMMTGHDWFPIWMVGVSMYSCFQTYRRSHVHYVHYWYQQARDCELLRQPVKFNTTMLKSNRASVPSFVRSMDIKKKHKLEYKCKTKLMKISLTSAVASCPYKTKR